MFEKSGYKNDWNGAGFPDGTYFYVLEVGEDKKFSNYLQLNK
ncbi:MAG: gliding motility-associated C-terminal domain-containing protein [Bacteroidota bacterium]